jgi:hypothetical protein
MPESAQLARDFSKAAMSALIRAISAGESMGQLYATAQSNAFLPDFPSRSLSPTTRSSREALKLGTVRRATADRQNVASELLLFHPQRDHTIMSAIAQGPLCSICNYPIELTNARADENGKAVHEECYLNKIKPPALSRLTPMAI